MPRKCYKIALFIKAGACDALRISRGARDQFGCAGSLVARATLVRSGSSGGSRSISTNHIRKLLFAGSDELALPNPVLGCALDARVLNTLGESCAACGPDGRGRA